MDDLRPDPANVSRRSVLAGAGAAVAGAAVLTACGGGSDGQSSAPGGGASTDTDARGGSGGGEPGTAIATLADIPVGGAVSAQSPDGKPLIVARPRSGTAVAFSAVCTHMGCTVAPKDRILQCPCHGSQYDPATGKVLRGPAPRALAKVDVEVSDGKVVST